MAFSIAVPGLGAATAMPAFAQTQPPAPDLLEVTFEDGTATDAASNRTATSHGEPQIAVESSLARQVATFDGDDGFAYPLTSSDYEVMAEGFTVECSFQYTEDIASTGTICGNRQGGGFGLIAKDDQLQFMVHDGDGYKYAKAPMTINRWYHAVGVFTGDSVQLYVNGQLIDETAAAGAMLIPPNEQSHNFVIGADSSNGGIESFATAAIDDVRLFGTALSGAQVQALNSRFADRPEVDREADILAVDFEDGFTDTAAGRTVKEIGEVPIHQDGALQRQVATFDGKSSLLYPLADAFESMSDSFTLECSFRFDGELPSGSTNICASKEAGGMGLVTRQGQLAFMVHDGAGYKYAQADFDTDRWYHAAGVFDGSSVKLYLDGQLVANTPTDNDRVHWQANDTTHSIAIGADAANHGGASGHTTATVDEANIYSDALTADEIVGLSGQTFGAARQLPLTIESTNPSEGSHLTEATELNVTWNIPDLVSRNTDITLDGEAVEPGQPLGAGLSGGSHELGISGLTVFGRAIDETISFTSGSIPTEGGSQTGQGEGAVTLAARADNPDGGDVRTVFYEGQVDMASQGFQGLIPSIPETLEFEYTEEAQIEEAGESHAAGRDEIPFQRFDVDLQNAKGAIEGQAVRWTGELDPARQAHLLVWNTASETWDETATGRGLHDGELVLSGAISADHIVNGTAHVMVVASDPFADDIEERIQDNFADPSEYDFSIAHLTDTQYISEGAVDDSFSAEQQAVWADAYLDTVNYLAENADEHQLAYIAHTGDVIENWHAKDPEKAEPSREISVNEYEFASQAQEIIDQAEIPNGVLPGNHDNRSGVDTGAEAMFNDFFGPERYEALEKTQGWREANASYHPYTADDNSNHYDLFTAGGLDFIAVHLGFGVTAEEAAWASDVLDQYPDRNAIIMTHAHKKPSSSADGRGSAFSVDGDIIDDELLKQHDNVVLVLSGHEHGVSIDVRQDVGTEDNTVVEMLADYQNYRVTAEEAGLTDVDGLTADDTLRLGASFFRMLQFDVDRSELIVDTYSPFLDDFGATEHDGDQRYDGSEDDTRLPIQLATRSTSFATDSVLVTSPTDNVIGEETVPTGWPASVEWSGLTEGETYAWYATSYDAETGNELEAGRVDQMGVFTAVAEGTDVEAPEIRLPDDATIHVGDAFNPMSDVTASDNTDGDLTSEIQVIGSVDTTTEGIYTLTYVVDDTNGNQSIASRSIVVEAVDETNTDGGTENANDDSEDPETPVSGGETPENNNSESSGDDADSSTNGSDNDSSKEHPASTEEESVIGGNYDGPLANTGAGRSLVLTLAGLLSVAGGLAAWSISKRRKSAKSMH